MKKYFLLILILFIVGCSMNKDTPTSKVEELFNNYNLVEKSVEQQLDTIINNYSEFDNNQKEEYKSVMIKNYKDLKYEILDERIDENSATVEVNIEVYDYYSAIKYSDEYLNNNSNEFIDENGNLDKSMFINYKISMMNNVKDKITYNLNITLTKEKDKWIIDNLTDSDIEKIHGIYNY